MKSVLMALLVGALAHLGLHAQTNQEVVLTASSGSKLSLAIPAPQAVGIEGGRLEQEFMTVLRRDLDESGPFRVLSGALPRTTDAASHKAWTEAGTDWLVNLKATRAGDEVRLEAQVVDVRPGKAVFTRTYTGKEATLRMMAHTLSDDLVYTLTRERGVASSRVVFVRTHGPGLKEIWQVDRDGSGARQLTHHQSLTLSPSVASDGRLAYVTYKSGSPEIWGQRVPGGPHVKLAPVGGQYLGAVKAPVWSPDGQRLAYAQVTNSRTGDTDIMVLEMATGKVRRLTFNNGLNTGPTWNPSGTQLAFESDRDGAGMPQIFLMEADGSNMRRLTTRGTYNTSPSWSPSGAQIAFVSRFEGKFDLFVYKLGEGRDYQITTGVSFNEDPAWSPDERRLIFSSGPRGGKKLFTTDLTGNQVIPLGTLTGCEMPDWTRSR